jgi:hypothetical protein
MERMFKKIFSLSLLLSFCAAFAADEPSKAVTPKFTIRSQGTDAARRMMGSVGHVMLYDMEKWYGTLSFTPEYTRAFDRDDIAKCLFGDSLDCKKLKIQGSRVEGRDDDALLADYFYLPTDFSSEVSFKPLIQNFLVDINFFLGLDEWVQGLYFFAQFPITYTKWDLNCCESVKATGTLSYNEGYFSTAEIARENLLTNFTSYARGNAPGAATDADNTGITTTFKGLTCAKICCGSADTKTTVSEFRFALGYNFLLDEDYHLGLNFQVVAPTGNNPKADFLFAAQNGNDNHWEVGGALNASFILWRSEDEEKHFGFYFDANLTHMFKNDQKRCFDLCGKPLSRYMLAEKMQPFADVATASQIENGAGTTDATYQFNNEFAPVANITALNVDVSVGINADIVAMFNYTSNDWSWDIGYNFWGRSCEKIRLDCECTGFEENTWALKGDAHVYGYRETINTALPLSATQSKATINGGTNFGTAGVVAGSATETADKLNPNVDSPELAVGKASGDNLVYEKGAAAGATTNINSSFPAVLIKQSDINFARTKGISHKVFSHLSYNWFDREDWIPYVGVGFEAEFASNSSDCNDDCSSCDSSCDTSCDTSCGNSKTNGDCIKCGLNQWGILVKAGVSF